MLTIEAKSLFGAVSLANNMGANIHGYKRVNGVYVLRVSM